MDELRQELQQDEVAESLETAERLLDQCAQHRSSCLEACASTIAQGEALLQELRDSTDAPDTTGSVSEAFIVPGQVSTVFVLTASLSLTLTFSACPLDIRSRSGTR